MEKTNEINDRLVKSFKQLARKQPIEKITINEITELAGVIRPTFYNHFGDKYALLEYIIRTELLLPVTPLFLNDMISEGLTLLFNCIHNEKKFYEMAVRLEGQNSFESIVRNEVKKWLMDIINEIKGGSHAKYEWLSRETIAEYYSQAMCYVAITWIKRDMIIEPKELAEIYSYLTKRSMMEILDEFA